MPTPTVTYTFAANTLALANEANTNFSDILTWLINNAIQKDASLAFTGVPSGPATNPSSANHLARKGYVDGPYVFMSRLAQNLGSVGGNTAISGGWTTHNNNLITPAADGFTVNATGTFLVSCLLMFATSFAGTRRCLGLRKNADADNFASDARDNATVTSGFQSGLFVQAPIALVAGDVVHVEYVQDTGGALNSSTRLWAQIFHGTWS